MPNTPTNLTKLAFSLKEGAGCLGLSRWTLISWARKGRLRTIKLGSRVMIPRDELLRLATQGTDNPEGSDE